MRLKHLVPNLVTLANIAFGFVAVLSAAEGLFERACVFLFLAALCDMCDGPLARRMNASTKFGMELDSLSDAVSFGFAPGVLVYFAVLRELGAVGLAISVLYVLCGVLRLARFNVDSRAIAKVTFLGIPIPAAAGYIVSFVLVRGSIPIWLLAVGTLLVALCMVSTLKVPKFRKGGCPSFMLYIGLAFFVWLLFQPSALSWHAWNGWNMVMLVANYVALYRNGFIGRRAAQNEDPSVQAT